AGRMGAPSSRTILTSVGSGPRSPTSRRGPRASDDRDIRRPTGPSLYAAGPAGTRVPDHPEGAARSRRRRPSRPRRILLTPPLPGWGPLDSRYILERVAGL